MEADVAIGKDDGVAPGDLLAGRYRVVRLLGRGGMAVVVEAMHESMGQRVAVKLLRAEAATSPEAFARFLLEAKALAQIRSVHVARVIDVGAFDDAIPYFVMEYLDGHDLATALAKDGPLSIATVVDYGLQICEALAEAHAAGIVHRDIKPGNLFLTREPAGGRDGTLVKLLDFGISIHTLAAGTDATLGGGGFMGSPRYMAPEQMRSARRVDHRADIWSLGVVLHEALAGSTPFVGDTLPEVCAAIAADDAVRVRQLRRHVPIELQDVILRCLEKNPEDRYADVGQLAAALASFTAFAPADASIAASRVARIVLGGTGTLPPPPPVLRDPGALPLEAPGPLEARQEAPRASQRPVASMPIPGPGATDGTDLRLWVVVVAVVAIPAFIVGALVRPLDGPRLTPPAHALDAGAPVDGGLGSRSEPGR